MEKSFEELLYQAVIRNDCETVKNLLSKGANPNKTASFGKTSLGEAANIGNIDIVKLLIDASKYETSLNAQNVSIIQKKRFTKSQKRKHKSDDSDINSKYKNCNDRKLKEYYDTGQSTSLKQENRLQKNQGYFVCIHGEGSSSDDSKVSSLKSPLSNSSLTPSPQSDLEWDEEIDNETPVVGTSEDETWTSMYQWYAAILECTGAAIAAAAPLTNGIDQQDTYMRTALHYAAEQSHVDVISLLINAGAKLDLTAGDGSTPLHIAVIKNNKDIVKLLIAAGSNVNYKTHEKATALHFAASRGYLEMVNILVSNGAYVEARDTNERTPLYVAVVRGHIEVVEYLVSRGANVNSEQIHGYTPLCEAIWQKFTKIAELLLSSGARITHSHKLLHNAVLQRQDLIVTMLADMGGGINLHNENGDTPLLLAVRVSQLSIVKVLLARGANVNACNSITGANALHIAVENIDNSQDFEDFLVCLLEHKININSTALTGDTALNRALLLHKDDAAVLMIRHGADVNICDLLCCGLDNLSIASKRQSPDLARIIVKAGHCLHVHGNGFGSKITTTVQWLNVICKEPLCLSDLCRIKIRNMCSKRHTLISYVCSLPLPTTLKKFLMIEEEGNFTNISRF